MFKNKIELFSINIGAVKNIGWSIFDRAFRMLTGMFVGVWLARYLQPTSFGLLSYSQVLSSSLMAIANLGLTNILLTRLIHKDGDEKTLISTAFFLKLLSGFCCYLIIILTCFLFYRTEDVLITLIIITSTTLFFQSFDVLDVFFQSKVLSKKSVLAKTGGFFIGTITKLILLILHAPLIYFALSIIFEVAFSSLLLIYLYFKFENFELKKIYFDYSLAKNLFKVSWPIMLSDLLIFVYMRIDQIMLENLTSLKELGLYSAALKLSESWYFLAGAITNSFYPSFAKFWNSDKDLFFHNYKKMIHGLFLMSFSVAIIVTFFGNHIVDLTFGSNYAGVSDILVIHIWTGIPIFIGVGCTNLFIMNGLQKFSIYKSISGAVLNIILNFILIPNYGAIGASIATLISQIFASYLINGLFKSTRDIFRLQTKSVFTFSLFKYSR